MVSYIYYVNKYLKMFKYYKSFFVGNLYLEWKDWLASSNESSEVSSINILKKLLYSYFEKPRKSTESMKNREGMLEEIEKIIKSEKVIKILKEIGSDFNNIENNNVRFPWVVFRAHIRKKWLWRLPKLKMEDLWVIDKEIIQFVWQLIEDWVAHEKIIDETTLMIKKIHDVIDSEIWETSIYWEKIKLFSWDKSEIIPEWYAQRILDNIQYKIEWMDKIQLFDFTNRLRVEVGNEIVNYIHLENPLWVKQTLSKLELYSKLKDNPFNLKILIWIHKDFIELKEEWKIIHKSEVKSVKPIITNTITPLVLEDTLPIESEDLTIDESSIRIEYIERGNKVKTKHTNIETNPTLNVIKPRTDVIKNIFTKSKSISDINRFTKQEAVSILNKYKNQEYSKEFWKKNEGYILAAAIQFALWLDNIDWEIWSKTTNAINDFELNTMWMKKSDWAAGKKVIKALVKKIS